LSRASDGTSPIRPSSARRRAEVEVTFLDCLARVLAGFGSTALVPKHYRATAILTLGMTPSNGHNRADGPRCGPPLVVRIKRGPWAPPSSSARRRARRKSQ
jgi:hypothetical protein